MSPKGRLLPLGLVLSIGLSLVSFAMWRTQAAKTNADNLETKPSVQAQTQQQTQDTNLFSKKSAFEKVMSKDGRTIELNGSITTLNSAATENFNTLAQTGAANAWTDNTTIGSAYSTATTYIADNGGGTTGGLYSYGSTSSSDRALGSLVGPHHYAFRLVNNTGVNIGALSINYTGEQWRDANTNDQTLDFQFQVANAGVITDANTPSTGWSNFNSLDFTSPQSTNVGALDGNAAANRTAISATLTFATPVANGQEIWIRWEDVNHSGNDHGFAIDDFSVSAIGAPQISKSFDTSPISPGGTSGLTITVTNPNPTTALIGVGYTDTLPAGLTTPNLAATPTCGGTLSITSNVITLTGATVAAGGGTCIVNRTVTGATPGVKNNVTSAVTSTNGGTGNTAAASLTVTCPTSFTVNDTGDAADANAGNGFCSTAGGVCTLRAAIQEANALTGCANPIDINFSITGTITLTSSLPAIAHNVNINGPGAANLTVSGATSFRPFNIGAGTTVLIDGLTIANGRVSGDGGGISNFGNLTLSDSVVTNNGVTAADNPGGGIYTASGTLTITNSTISNNTANVGTNADGGGIYIDNGGTVSITNSTISGNTASDDGGGVDNNGIVTITGSTISGNTATGGDGGGIRTDGAGTLTLTNVTVSGNNAGNDGGGIYVVDPTTLNNCTVTNNTTAAQGGGVWMNANLTVKNTIIAANTALSTTDGPDIEQTGGTLTRQDYNLIGTNDDVAATFPTGSPNANGDYVGTTGSLVSPGLEPLATNGGPTQTHRLLTSSLAIDQGSTGTTTDQRGFARPFDNPSIANNPDATANSGNGSDIGAFEMLPSNKAPLDFDGDGISDYAVVTDAGSPIASDASSAGKPLFIRKTNEMMRFIRADKKPSLNPPPRTPEGEIKADGTIETERETNAGTEGVIAQARWIIRLSATNTTDSSIVLGAFTDYFVPADYDGDGECDAAVWTPGTAIPNSGVFTVRRSSDSLVVTYNLGDENSDATVVGDYDGDGRADPAVFNTNTGIWSYLGGVNHTTQTNQSYGQGGGFFNLDYPVPGDFNGDGRHDFGIMRRAVGNPGLAKFLISYNDGSVDINTPDLQPTFGDFQFAIVPGDYDGDGKCDIAQVNLQGTQIMWRVLQSSDATTQTGLLGDPATDYTVQADYDGNGRIDLSRWTSAGSSEFAWVPLLGGSTTTFNLGGASDYPVGYYNTH